MQVILHSCGYVKPLIPHLLDAGLDCLQPLEVKAGMDLLELKREFGKDLAFMGGIDVRTFNDPDPQALEQEIATKISAAKVGGGYIYHSDHSIPNNISFPQYCRAIDLVKKYGGYR
jgi:uroporphyrinogen decarboxylase